MVSHGSVHQVATAPASSGPKEGRETVNHSPFLAISLTGGGQPLGAVADSEWLDWSLRVRCAHEPNVATPPGASCCFIRPFRSGALVAAGTGCPEGSFCEGALCQRTQKTPEGSL